MPKKLSKDEENTYEVKISPEVVESLTREAEAEEVEVDKVIERMLTDGFVMLDVGESVVKLKGIDPWGGDRRGLDAIGEDGSETVANIKEFRRLREEFPPVTAGIDYSKAFTSGSGFDVKIEEPTDTHQVAARDLINELNRSVFMDDITVGLDAILDIIIDETFTDGVGAAEIVYDGWEDKGYKFQDWAEPVPATEKETPSWRPKKMSDGDWKKLGGVRQLKIIPDAYHRLKPYRDEKTWQILYFTVDEASTSDEEEVIKLLPWQVLWLSWNRRRANLKGISMIKSVVGTALLLERILKNLGVSFDRWADKKYFFVLGDARQGRSWAPQNIRNFLRDIKVMADSNKTGIPVPAGFDVKDIGGEVYDGGTILDRLIGLICGGMKYPRTFLEQGRTQEGDKAWLAWLVSYGRHQTQLKRSIEHQLWKRHLYCKIGMVRTVPKQGVKKSKQEKKSIYVPKMEWSSEGKWHRETKLKMLKDWLNTANPVTPTFKIGLEEDAAMTLGYSELSFEEARDMIQEQIKIEKIQTEIDLITKQMELEAMQKAKKTKVHLKKDMEVKLPFISAPEPEEEESKSPEEELERRAKARQEGGVSKRQKPTGEEGQKGIAKSPGSTRKSKRVGEAEETGELEAVIPRQAVDVNINLRVKDGVLKVESEPIKVEKQEVEVVIKTDDEQLAVERSKASADQLQLKKDMEAMIGKAMEGLKTDKARTEQILDMVTIMKTEVEEITKKKEPTEKEKLDIELKQKKIEFMEQWMKENEVEES